MIHFLWFRFGEADAGCQGFGIRWVTWDKRKVTCPKCIAWLTA